MSLISIAFNTSRDDLIAHLSPLASRIESCDWDVYAKQAEFEHLREGRKADASLITYSLLQPSLLTHFASATVASACMTETTLFRLWNAMEVQMEPVPEHLRASLRYDVHGHGERITIYYASEEPWSKRYRDKSMSGASGSNGQVLDHIKTAIGSLFSAEPFLWMGNKDLGEGFFAQAGAARLPNTPHGLNSYQGYHNVTVISALNPPPAHFHFMEGKGVSGEELRTGCYRTAVYQAVMRCSIRNPDDATPKRVVVMDRDTADWLGALFPGAAIARLPGLDMLPSKGKAGRPRRHADGAAKAKAYRDEQERQFLAQLDLINGDAVSPSGYPQLVGAAEDGVGAFARDEIPSKEGDSVTPFASPPAPTSGTVFRSKYDASPLAHLDYEADDVFIAGLCDLHERVVDKEEAGLFAPAHFDPDKASETARGLANVTHVRGIWLDNDGGDLTHETFAALFPYLRVVVWNTASSTAAAPRWRAFIPTTCAMSREVQALIFAQLVKVLNRAGYWGSRQIAKQTKRPGGKPRLCHGFDEGKLNAAALFYLPCQARNPADSFFVDYGASDPKRGPLDLRAWIENCILDLRPEPESEAPVLSGVPATPEVNALEKGRASASLQAARDKLAAAQAKWRAGRQAAIVERAVQDWRGACRGEGHAAFFRLGARLQRAGLNEGEIAYTLRTEAIYAHSQAERRAEIKDILRSLRRRGMLTTRR